MPNGYDWLVESHETTHRWNRWQITTGNPSPGLESTSAGCQPAADVNIIGDAYRDPDELESRLLDVVLTPPRPLDVVLTPPASQLVPTFQCDEYDKKMYFEHLDEGTCRWAAPVDLVVASAWETTEDGEVRWVDAVPALAGVGGARDSSNMIVLKTSWLFALAPWKKPKRHLRSSEFAIALRQIVDTVVSVPMLRQWDNVIEEIIWFRGNNAIVENVLQRSLVVNHSYQGGVRGGPLLDDTIWFQARGLEEFREELEHGNRE